MSKPSQVSVETHKPGAQRLLMNNKCVAPESYEKAIQTIKNKCPDIGSRLYLTSGYMTEYSMEGNLPVSRRVPQRCAQAEYFAPGKSNLKLNRTLLKCLKRSTVSRAVGDIKDGKRVLKALKKAVEDSKIPWTEEYSTLIGITVGVLAFIGTAALFMFGVPWAGRRFFGGGGHGPQPPAAGAAASGNVQLSPDQLLGLAAAVAGLLSGTQVAPSEAPEKEATPAEEAPETVGEAEFRSFQARVANVLGQEAAQKFIDTRGHDFQSLNLLPASAFAQTVREYAMWDGIIDTPASTVSSPARDLIMSGAAYLNQAHVRNDIQKFKIASLDGKVAVLQSAEGNYYYMPKSKLSARVRSGSYVSVRLSALRPAPRPRVRVRGVRFVF